jgi:hypothetical protein
LLHAFRTQTTILTYTHLETISAYLFLKTVALVLKYKINRIGGVAHTVELLLCKLETLSSNTSPTKKEKQKGGREEGREEGRKLHLGCTTAQRSPAQALNPGQMRAQWC